MKRAFIALVTLVATASAACRQYDVDVYKDFNGSVWAGDGVSQSFICTADSWLWAGFFVGAANSGGQYELDIEDSPDGTVLYQGLADAGPSYEYVAASLNKLTNDVLVKGKTYYLKVTIPNPRPEDSLNWYADTTNPYPYGRMLVQGDAPLRWDLCARIEG